MKPRTLVRLALAGTRTDTLRVLLTALSAALATLAVLAALTVLAIPTPPLADPDNYRSNLSTQYASNLLQEPGLRPGLAFALLLLTIPVLALAGQCARLGAPARDRRLATFRMAGATPGQTLAIAAAETGLASLLGSATGLAAYLVGRMVLDRPDAAGRLTLPTDVLPATPALSTVVLGLPLLAALLTALLLRRVVVTPFGVARSAPLLRRPASWPGVLIGLGLLGYAMIWRHPEENFLRISHPLPGWVAPLILIVGNLLAVLGVLQGAAWMSYTAGRLLHRFGRRPAALLAARRLMADPWAGSRTFTALLTCVVLGAGGIAFRAYFAAMDRLAADTNRLANQATGEPPVVIQPDPFYLNTMDLVDAAVNIALVIAAAGLLVTLAEGVVARRRTYAALVAAGVPRGVLGRSIGWQVLTPALPAILLALVVGEVLGRTYNGARISQSYTRCDAAQPLCQDPATAEQHLREFDVSRVVDVPVHQLTVFGAGAVAAVLVTIGVGLLFLRASTSVEELRTG